MTTLLTIIISVFLLTFIYAGFRGAPWAPTKNRDIERFLRLADVRSGQKMYDLGCGDGRLVCAAAKAGARAQGYEVALLPFILANIRRLFSKDKRRIKISYCDIWHVNLRDADIVYFFLIPKVYPKLKEKFEKELRKGTKVIAYVWPIEGWQALKIDNPEGRLGFYLYEI